MNNTKMAVTKIELAVKQGGKRGGGRLVKSAEHTHTVIHWSIYDCITLSITSSSKAHV